MEPMEMAARKCGDVPGSALQRSIISSILVHSRNGRFLNVKRDSSCRATEH